MQINLVANKPKWCESQTECERLRLTDLLAKPMQRLTRYSLLLRAIAKRTDDRDQSGCLEQMVSFGQETFLVQLVVSC